MPPPPVPSCGKTKQAIIADVSKVLSRRKNQVVMDLGSGWGTLLLPLARKFPKHHFIGIEYGCIPYFVSKFRARKISNITFLRQNFFNSDVSKADIVLTFLMNSTMAKLTPKLLKEAKCGALVYANRFQMKNVKATRKVFLGSKYDTYYVYKM
ncbi:MAG: methyltransferase domain-containing protein [Alphaproteobacteria bacterium]|nr:methyltransferase domain-containing protein [Alphaproteobacteria bacterium]